MNKPKPIQHGLLFLMKVTLIHLVVSLFSIAMAYAIDSAGQGVLDRRVTIEVEGAEFQNVLLMIGKQAKVKFAYSPQVIKNEKKVTLNLQDEKLADVLSTLLGSSYSYRIVGNQIVLTPQDQSIEITEGRAAQNGTLCVHHIRKSFGCHRRSASGSQCYREGNDYGHHNGLRRPLQNRVVHGRCYIGFFIYRIRHAGSSGE